MKPLIQATPSRYISYVGLRRQATRAARILDKHKDKDPTIDVLYDTLAPTIQRYTVLYDHHQVRLAARTAKTATAHGKIDELGRAVGIWLAVLASDIAVDASVLRPRTDVPDDVIARGVQFIDLLESHVAQSDAPHAGAQKAIDELRPAVAEAQASWIEARLAITGLQEEAQDVRDHAADLHAGLVKLRRVLSNVLGRRHLDYQALRVRRGAGSNDPGDEATDEVVDDEGDADTVAEVEPEPGSNPRAANGTSAADDAQQGIELDAVAGE